jgi:hypothetical protein
MAASLSVIIETFGRRLVNIARGRTATQDNLELLKRIADS